MVAADDRGGSLSETDHEAVARLADGDARHEVGEPAMARARRDADRRSRQCAKFARLIRIARLVMGNGRWGPDDLAREIECSQRTIFRDVEVLSAAGIPIYFDKSVQAYRVPDGFRFTGIEPAAVDVENAANPMRRDLLGQTRRLLRETESFLERLRGLCRELESPRPPPG